LERQFWRCIEQQILLPLNGHPTAGTPAAWILPSLRADLAMAVKFRNAIARPRAQKNQFHGSTHIHLLLLHRTRGSRGSWPRWRQRFTAKLALVRYRQLGQVPRNRFDHRLGELSPGHGPDLFESHTHSCLEPGIASKNRA